MRILIVIFLCFTLISLNAQDCASREKSFDFGERVDYTIYYYLAGVWVSAGEVFFEVDSLNLAERKFYHFNSIGQTFKKYDWIYKVRDHFESVVDLESFKPIRFKRSVNEGSTFIREDYLFKQKSNIIITQRQMEEEGPNVRDTIPLLDCSFDVMSMIYYARDLDFSMVNEGDTLPIKIILDNETHNSYIRYLGKKEVKVKGLGKYRCILFSPLLIEGTIFNGGEDMTVWVTDDKNRVPIYIETPILVGSIRARANKLSGLKYPIESKVD